MAADAAPVQFQSTLSVRRATWAQRDENHTFQISIHALREESDPAGMGNQALKGAISIHALREESDGVANAIFNRIRTISIHALREESDKADASHTPPGVHFNPRSP